MRAAILAATRALIREQGLAGATSSAIAERADAAEGSIHYHFGAKEALLETAILETLEPLQAHTRRERTGSRDSARVAVLEFARTLERSYGELVPLLAAVQSDPQLRDALAPRLSAHDLGPHRAVGRLSRLLTDSEPDCSGADAEAAALLIVGACFLRAWQRQMDTHRRHRLPSLARAVAVLLRAGAKDA